MSDAQPIVRKGIKLGVKRDADEFAESAQVIKENFPKQRSLHLQPKGGEPLTGERVDIVVTEEVLLATAHHVAQDTSKESGGFLLGNRYECPNTERQYIIIDQFMKADYTEGTQVSLTFTTDSWAQLTERMGGKYRGKQLVGWYHSHPGMGIFLSNYDLDIHKNRFANEWDVALVLDPIKHEGGFFAWVGGNVNPREKVDFYELLDGDSRETVTAWTNHTAVDPKTGAPAKLKAVNTQNSDGNPLSISATSQKSQAATASGGLFSNPLMLIGGAAVLGLLFLGMIVGAIWYFIPSGNTANTNSNTGNTTVNNKVLNGERIRIGKDMKARVKDSKMSVDLQINGIGGSDVIEEIRKSDNLQIEINGKPATVTDSSIDNGAILKVRAETDLSEEAVANFKADKQQDFTLGVDMFYNGDVISKKIETKFSKGKGNDSLGELVAFSTEKFEEKNVTPTKTKPNVVEKQDRPQTQDNDKPQTQQQTTQKKEDKPKNQGQTTTTKTPVKQEGTGIREKTEKAVDENIIKPIESKTKNNKVGRSN